MPGPVSFDRECDGIARPCTVERYTASRREFHGVAKQVEEHLTQLAGIWVVNASGASAKFSVNASPRDSALGAR